MKLVSDLAWQAAAQRTCPTCGAEPWQKCTTLGPIMRRKPRRSWHPARLPEAARPVHRQTIGGAECLGSNMPVREVADGEEPTDHFQ